MPSPESPELPKLPHKRRRFLDAYLGEARFNGAEAARIAGYANPRQEASRLLSNDDILAHKAHDLKQSGVDRDAALSLIVMGATRTDAEILGIAKAEDSEIVRSTIVSSLFNERTTHTTNLAKAHGLFTENINVSGSLRREIVIVDGDDE